jgi:hypothetical protein
VDEYVGSLVATLNAHQKGDARLEIFAKLLGEEWDCGVFLDLLSAQARARARTLEEGCSKKGG